MTMLIFLLGMFLGASVGFLAIGLLSMAKRVSESDRACATKSIVN